ncbi:MAG: hypothetical protein IJO33_04420 [Bacilli bacterium]|nr:hypothetical protein [Bacilli bacterium]
MNKLLVKISYPRINQEYEMFIPINKTIAKILMLVQKAISEINVDYIPIKKDVSLVKKNTGEVLPMNEIVKNTSIEQGDVLVIL